MPTYPKQLLDKLNQVEQFKPKNLCLSDFGGSIKAVSGNAKSVWKNLVWAGRVGTDAPNKISGGSKKDTPLPKTPAALEKKLVAIRDRRSRKINN